MGIPVFPNVCGGLLPTLIINVAMSITLVKGLLCSLFQTVGLRRPSAFIEQENVTYGIFDEYSVASNLLLPSMSEEVCQALPLTLYNPDCSRSDLGVPECSVCLSDFHEGQEVRQLPVCNHMFHRNCLDQWLNHKQMTCPLCRISLVPPEVAKKHRKIQQELEEEMMLWFSPIHGGFHGLWCQI